MLIPHTYCKFDETEYKDYALLLPCSSDTLPEYAIDTCFFNYIRDLKSFSFIKTNPVPRNSLVYVTPFYPFAIDDVRAHYTIKRNPQDADYIIISPYKNGSWRGRDGYNFLIDTDQKIIVCGTWGKNTKQDILNFASDYNIELSSDSIFIEQFKTFYWINDEKLIYKQLLDNSFTKPVYLDTALDINGDLELTLDVLQLVYNTAVARYKEADTLVQLQVLNQYNWRQYPYTIQFLKRLINAYPGATSWWKLCDKSSQLPKTAKAIMYSESPVEPITEKDFNLRVAFADSFLHIGDIKFAAIPDIIRKIHEIYLDIDVFSEIYNTTTRITPRTYAQKNN